MALPEGMYRFVPGEEELQKFISSAANQSVRPYNTNEEYLYAMKEDLAEWFKELYQVNIYVDNFIEFLQDGNLLCEHANSVNEKANEFRVLHRGDPILDRIILPSKTVHYNPGRHASTFFARDNVANFIGWCRKELRIAEAVMFESNDLILRKNEKNFILCLLEVARRGSKFGVPAPVLIQMEEEIDEEIEQDLRDEQSEEECEEQEEEIIREPPKQKVACDFKSLDEMIHLFQVQYILGMCTCPTQFPMVKVSEGKYKVGDSKTLIFMRILRNHVMVRVGGGWDTLEHYLDKHDPCRCNRHRVEQKIATRIRDLGIVLTPEEEQELISRAKRETKRDFTARNRSLSSLNAKQAAEIMNKAGTGGGGSSGGLSQPRNSELRKSRDDWSNNNIKSQSLPGFNNTMSTVSPGRGSKVREESSTPRESRKSKSTNRTSEAMNQNSNHRNDIMDYFDVDASYIDPRHAPQNRARSRSPAPDRGSKSLSRYSTDNKRQSNNPEIKITKSSSSDLNNTYPGSRDSKSGNLRTSKNNLSLPGGNKSPPKSPTERRSKTPTPGNLRSSSTSALSHEYSPPRRSVTPTPMSTSERRAALSVSRSKSPDPDRMLRTSTKEEKRKSTPRGTKGPPSSYRNSETLPRNYKTTEKHPKLETSNSRPSTPRSTNTDRRSASTDRRYNSLPRPSSAMAIHMDDEVDSGRKSATLSVTRGSSHHKSMQDIRDSRPARPKSALGIYSSTSNLSTVPSSTNNAKNQGRKTVASTTANNSMQRLNTKNRSQSMDNLPKQLSTPSPSVTQRNMFFERLSRPKTAPKNKTKSNIVDEDVLLVERKGEGSHVVQRNTVQRPDSPRVEPHHSNHDHAKLIRESSTSSDTSSQSAHQQQPITPSDLRLRINRNEPEKRSYKSQGSSVGSTPSPSRDSALASSLRLSVSMTGSPESPSSRVSYSWTPDSGGDELDSPSSGHPAHTPKIIDRRKPNDSHLKAPPKRKVSKEEVIHVVRNPEGHHQWEHTDASIEQSQEYIEMSPYKDQLSPRSSRSEKPLRSSLRKGSSSSESSAISPGNRNPPPSNSRVSKAQITIGKPARTSTPVNNRISTARELQVASHNYRPKNGIGSTSSSSMGSTRSSIDGNRRKGNSLTDEVRAMLFTEDGKPRPSKYNTKRPTTPHTSTTPRSALKQRPVTPRSETLPRPSRAQARPTTPVAQTRTSTLRMRPKTPENRRGVLTRQEKLKSWDGPSPKKEPEVPQQIQPKDKESRMLQEMEREFAENQKKLAAAGSVESEDRISGNESFDHMKSPVVEYDYNGRRIQKKQSRSKSPANLRHKSAARMDSVDSEATNRSFETADSLADSEDFEVAMAMSGGAKRNTPSTIRSRSVDDFLDDRGPRPRKDRHESRKSRIPTPVHFNSGRKSVTGVPYHDSEASKSAMRSNIEGVGSHEIERNHQKKGQRSQEDNARDRGWQNADMDRYRSQPQREFHPQKENIQPPIPSHIRSVEEYNLDGQECFTFGRHGNTKTKPPRKNADHLRNDQNNLKTRNAEFSDIKAQYFRQDDSHRPMENRFAEKDRGYNHNSNNNNNSDMIGQSMDQSQEPIPPPRKKGGYHRSNLHSSPADLLKPNSVSSNQIHSRPNASTNQSESYQYERNEPKNERHYSEPKYSSTRGHQQYLLNQQSAQDQYRVNPSSNKGQHQYSMGQHSQDHYGQKSPSARGHQQVIPSQHPQDRNDSGIEIGTDPESPGSSSAMSMRSAINGDNSLGSKSGTSGGSVFSPEYSPHQIQPNSKWDQSNQSAYQLGRAQTTVPNHGIMETTSGKYYYVSPTSRNNPRLHTGYDIPNQNQPYQPSSGYYSSPSKTPNQLTKSPSPSNYQSNQSAKPYYQPEKQYSPQKTNYDQSHGDHSHDVTNTYQSPGYHSTSGPYSTTIGNQKATPEHPQVSQTRVSKRPNFNDFFNDNQKLKNSLSSLSQLYSENDSKPSYGSAFQLEDDPLIDGRQHGSHRSYGNAFTLSSTASLDHKKVSDARIPQYSNPPGYGHENLRGAPPSPNRRDGNNNLGQATISGGQYSPTDTPPAPPPRQKSHKALEKTKLSNLGPKYYSHISNDDYTQGSGDNFRFANGIDLQKANEDQEAMYV
ncbi:uncharacterized protein LOC120344340 isoform X2 [Styela clava]